MKKKTKTKCYTFTQATLFGNNSETVLNNKLSQRTAWPQKLSAMGNIPGHERTHPGSNAVIVKSRIIRRL